MQDLEGVRMQALVFIVGNSYPQEEITALTIVLTLPYYCDVFHICTYILYLDSIVVSMSYFMITEGQHYLCSPKGQNGSIISTSV